MFVLYNMLQAIFLPVFSPILALVVLCNSKYRGRIGARLGLGLAKKLPQNHAKGPLPQQNILTYWIHALSVGEVTSALPLATKLKNEDPGCRIVFSVTTKSGRQVADRILTGIVDEVIDGPLDILPVIIYFHYKIRPNHFILVETDFWPNMLLWLKFKGVPSLLVNGRISDEALRGYHKMRFFFLPIFRSFSALCMQTEVDRGKMKSLGVDSDRIYTLGNLKFDTKNPLETDKGSVVKSLKHILPTGKTIFIAGSTHPGEEQIILESYAEVKKTNTNIFLIIAPRDPKRAKEIRSLAKTHHLTTALRTGTATPEVDLFILDTIGELAACYYLADISFVGGSLVKKGGHNPIEPAIMSTPVIFGPHMEDFSEIAFDLVCSGGAEQVRNSQEMTAILNQWTQSQDLRRQKGQAAKNCVNKQRGVIKKHIELIQSL